MSYMRRESARPTQERRFYYDHGGRIREHYPAQTPSGHPDDFNCYAHFNQGMGMFEPTRYMPVHPGSHGSPDFECRAALEEIKEMLKNVIISQASDRIDTNKMMNDMEDRCNERMGELADKFDDVELRIRDIERSIVSIRRRPPLSPIDGATGNIDSTLEDGHNSESTYGLGLLFNSDNEEEVSSHTPEAPDLELPQTPRSNDSTLLTNFNLPASVMLSCLDTHEKREKQDLAYDLVKEALLIINGLVESSGLLESDIPFRENVARMVLCRDWYESRRHLIEPERPLPLFLLPHQILSRPPLSTNHQVMREANEPPNSRSTGRGSRYEPAWRDPELYRMPLLVNGIPFKKSFLHLAAKKNGMPLSVCNRLGIQVERRTTDPTRTGGRTNFLPVGRVKDVPVIFQGHVVDSDFVVVDTGDQIEDSLLFGRPFLSDTNATIDIEEGTISFDMSCDCGEHQLWRNARVGENGRRFQINNMYFCKDLAEVASDQAAVLGGHIPTITSERIEEILSTRKRSRFDPRSGEEAGPSTRRPRTGVDTAIGTGKTIEESNSDGEGNSPSDHELDPGDAPSTTPGNAPPS